MQLVTVGIGEIAISENPETMLVAPNLGSCLALSVYDRVRKRGGMVHCLLPLSHRNPGRAAKDPITFVDTGVAKLLTRMLDDGGLKSNLQIFAAGCGNINDPNDFFAIGKNNYAVLRKILWKNSLLIHAEHIGGAHPRSLKLCVRSGEVWIRVNGNESILTKGESNAIQYIDRR